MAITDDVICAVATPSGTGGVSIVRLSGSGALSIANSIIEKPLLLPRYAYYREVRNSDGSVLDNVLLTYFKSPHSYTGEDIIEISCHASPYIVRTVLSLCLAAGARMARAGEFTERAFLNGKLDLSQAEAVADIIASENTASHFLAMQQFRGGVSNEIALLRSGLLDLTSLLELELDFGEEDVEFASRSELRALLEKIASRASALRSSFALGNAIKEGIPVAIIGKPNAGKSTLLNALLDDEKALVSEVPGTTRDAIEDTVVLGGVKFRFIDTAGLRISSDIVERMGVERTMSKMQHASIWLYVFDVTEMSFEQAYNEISTLKSKLKPSENTKIIFVGNKTDITPDMQHSQSNSIIYLSARSGELTELSTALIKLSGADTLSQQQIILTNARHYDILGKVLNGLTQLRTDLENELSTDLLSQQLRTILNYLGEITGQINTDNILTNIFSRFCIGK
ncbi:MAG: tRNA uridine-5-carboxymethylaminomethyl(34) synthesis GTPase MnmE [Bacteroidales bacterium]|jgi:tRNA modification GTPase|nr:tRNA uridine-5-carboxymethylaminomethyl(34) synthesis GTPase MnmE [Bacteroidales bacterium]